MCTTLKHVLNINVICFHLFNDLYYYFHNSHPFSFFNQFYIDEHTTLILVNLMVFVKYKLVTMQKYIVKQWDHI
jgi:hypothetical protein